MFGSGLFGDIVWADLYDLAVIPGRRGGGGHGGSGFLPVDVAALLDRAIERGLGSLDDDEIAALMLLGLV